MSKADGMGAFQPGNRGVRGRFALRASGIATPRTPLFPELFRSFEAHPNDIIQRVLVIRTSLGVLL